MPYAKGRSHLIECVMWLNMIILVNRVNLVIHKFNSVNFKDYNLAH